MTEQRVLKPYEVDITVGVGRDEAWEAVTQPLVLRQWFGWDYDGLDAEIRQLFVDQATLIAPERMGWADGSYLEVTGDDERARVRAVREGNSPGDPDRFDAVEEAWRAFLVQLRFWLDHRPQGARRTLYLTGETTGKQALSLADGAWQRVGSRIAWTVDADGNLLVVAGRLKLGNSAAGAMEVTISTYGLGDEAFETLRESWSKRWVPVAAFARVTTAADPSPERA